MATADIYAVVSGQPIYGGRDAPGPSIPAWVPASGNIANASLNTISAVYPTSAPDTRTRGASGILSAWCSTVFAPWLGALGSIIVTGGGHADYLGNEVYRYDVATQMWSRILDPFDIPVSYALGVQGTDPTDGNGTGNGVSDLVYGEYWTDDTKSTVVTDQWCPTHTYGNILVVPPSAAGNTNGWLVTLGNFNRQCHYVDLDNPAAGWKRLGALLSTTGKTEIPGYGCALFDSLRSRIVCSPYNNGVQPYMYTIGVPSKTLSSMASDYLDTYYAMAFYDAADDVYLMARGDATDTGGRWKLFVVDPVTGLQSSPSSSGSIPAAASGSVCWIESKRQLVFWPGSGNVLYFAQAPTNPKTGTWAWSSRTFTGPSASTNGANPPYYRLHYVAALDAFIHVGNTTGPVQVWKL